ncbi:SCAN domain-containing protein 3-like [Watersipora subatra]|uniref:SCAN domain-containing protein 3-like n=1 Tax=Watersipora subatra TaxID=2589382 RepID=UPI00355BE3B1
MSLIANCSQLLVFIWYVHGDDFEEEFLFNHTLKERTRREDVFEAVSHFLQSARFLWNSICACTSDGAPAMLGCRSDFVPEFYRLIQESTIVNFIKVSALNTRLFRTLCQDSGADHENLVYPTEMRWLSRGRVLNRLSAELSDESEIRLKKLVMEHLTAMAQEMLQYFPDLDELVVKLVQNPFQLKVLNIESDLQKELIDLINDLGAKDKFNDNSLTMFWCAMVTS